MISTGRRYLTARLSRDITSKQGRSLRRVNRSLRKHGAAEGCTRGRYVEAIECLLGAALQRCVRKGGYVEGIRHLLGAELRRGAREGGHVEGVTPLCSAEVRRGARESGYVEGVTPLFGGELWRAAEGCTREHDVEGISTPKKVRVC